ncbi:hypothetical protein ACSLNR_27870, partial [Escherichia coli]
QKLGERFDQKIIDKTLALLSGKSVDEAEKISADAVTPWVVGDQNMNIDKVRHRKVSLRIFVCGQYKIFQKLLAFALSPPGQHP